MKEGGWHNRCNRRDWEKAFAANRKILRMTFARLLHTCRGTLECKKTVGKTDGSRLSKILIGRFGGPAGTPKSIRIARLFPVAQSSWRALAAPATRFAPHLRVGLRFAQQPTGLTLPSGAGGRGVCALRHFLSLWRKWPGQTDFFDKQKPSEKPTVPNFHLSACYAQRPHGVENGKH